jgi:hypothetical protein
MNFCDYLGFAWDGGGNEEQVLRIVILNSKFSGRNTPSQTLPQHQEATAPK